MSQTIRLRGVVDDGTTYGFDVPRDTARTIQVPLFADVTIELEVTNNAGVPVDLATSSPAWTAWLSVVRTPDACEQRAGTTDYQLATTTVKASTKNVAVFEIGKAALRKLAPGRYFYDIVLSLNGERFQVVRVSGFHLTATFRAV